jgi:hypothetical protein
LNSDGTVKAHQKINETNGGFTGNLDNEDVFGQFSIASLGDLDGDSITDIAVGAVGDDDGGAGRGALWILFLNADGTVKNHQKISSALGNFTGSLDNGDAFGSAVTSLGDIDGDGVQDIAVGAWQDDDGVAGGGAVWILFLNPDGTVKTQQKISMTEGNFTQHTGTNTRFGRAVASLGDLNGDSKTDLAVGTAGDDDGGSDRGAVWMLMLDNTTDCKKPLADLNQDCRVDIGDFALLSHQWMLDCLADPNNLACVPNDFCRDAIEVFVDSTHNGITDIATGTNISSCGAFEGQRQQPT